MTITREQIADLRPGDVVELAAPLWPDGTVIRGGLHGSAPNDLFVGPVRIQDYVGIGILSLTVVSRAPRPLYVNHPRTEPVPGDVVRDADDPSETQAWWFTTNVAPWKTGGGWTTREYLPDRLRLLVDGEVGQVVP